jgi:Zn-dependent M16 (insulinase) family peptidase
VESGGDPDFIPTLTYEKFIEFHKTYYHPSNSYLYLYGNMDFTERLEWLDTEYLSKFDRAEISSEIRMQRGFDSVRQITDFYSLGEEEDVRDNTYLSLNTVVGDALDKQLGLTFQILEYVLLEAPGAPIKQALLDANIGKDIMGSYEDEYLQPMFMIIAKNSEEEKKEQFVSIVHDVIAKLVNEGIPEKSLRAAINFYEFKYREADYGQFPKGLIYGLRIMGSWLYDDSKPFLHLRDNEGYAFLKEKIGTGYYEQVLKKVLLENTHSSIVILKPKAGLNAEKEEKLKQFLASYKAKLSQTEIHSLVKETEHLLEYQETPSTKDELEKIPMIGREDIAKNIQPLYNDVMTIENVKVIHHNVYTSKIVYLGMLFDISKIPQDLWPYTSLLSLVLGYVDTKNYSYLELSNEINIHTGGMVTNVKSYSKKNSTNQYLPVFEFRTKVLYDELEEAFRLIREILFETKLEDTRRLKEIVDEMKSKMQMYFTTAGHSVAVDRAISYYSAHGLFKDITAGISFYQFLEELAGNFDARAEETIAKMKTLMQMIFTRENLSISITSDEEGLSDFRGVFHSLVERLPQKADLRLPAASVDIPKVPVQHNEGFKAALQVQYVARTGNFGRAGFGYSGALRVLKTILSYDYLWNNIRVKGGAYGCMCGFSGVDADAYFTSYRDPNLRETNQIYEETAQYVKTFTADEREITKYIIGTISSIDTPLTPQFVGKRSLSMYLSGITQEDLQRERDEVLQVTQEDIRSLHGLIQSVLDAGNICVIGNESKVMENKDLFKEVKSLVK